MSGDNDANPSFDRDGNQVRVVKSVNRRQQHTGASPSSRYPSHTNQARAMRFESEQFETPAQNTVSLEPTENHNSFLNNSHLDKTGSSRFIGSKKGATIAQRPSMSVRNTPDTKRLRRRKSEPAPKSRVTIDLDDEFDDEDVTIVEPQITPLPTPRNKYAQLSMRLANPTAVHSGTLNEKEHTEASPVFTEVAYPSPRRTVKRPIRNTDAQSTKSLPIVDLDMPDHSPQTPTQEVEAITDNLSRIQDMEEHNESPQGGGNALRGNSPTPSDGVIEVDADCTNEETTESQIFHIDNDPDGVADEATEDKSDLQTTIKTPGVSNNSITEEELESLRVLFDFPPHGRGKIQVTGEELRRLRRHEYLNDSLIDFYVKVIEHENINKNPAMRNSKCKFFSSFFFGRLRSGPSQCDYDGVKRWTNSVQLFSMQLVFVPICESAHWSLIIIANLDKLENILNEELVLDEMKTELRPKILYLDSLDPRRGTSFGRTMQHYLAAEWITRKTSFKRTRESKKEMFDKIKSVIKIEKPHVPQQINEVDCGLYLLYNLSCFLDESNGMKNELLEHGSQSKSIKNWYTHMQIHCLREEMVKLITVMDNARDGSKVPAAVPDNVQMSADMDAVNDSCDGLMTGQNHNHDMDTTIDPQTEQLPLLDSARHQPDARTLIDAYCVDMIDKSATEDVVVPGQSLESQQLSFPIQRQDSDNINAANFDGVPDIDSPPPDPSCRTGGSAYRPSEIQYSAGRARRPMPRHATETRPPPAKEHMDLTSDNDKMDTGA